MASTVLPEPDLPRPAPAEPAAAAQRSPSLVSVVVPLHDEEAALPELHRRLRDVLDGLGVPWELVAVDDGSRDRTGWLLAELAAEDGRVRPVWLTRNFGHQPAVCAGLDHARGDVVVVMDGDLQDPPEVLPALLEAWRGGQEVVYAVRRDRKEAAWLKAGYHLFYRLLRQVSEIGIPLDAGDFCLMDRAVVEALRSVPERQRFIRGLRSWVGFRQVGVPYERSAREAGTTKYTIRRLLGLALDGLVSFSSRPLRVVSLLGASTLLVALALLVWVFADALTTGTAPRGWASVMVVVLVLGSIQLISVGVLGEYVRIIFLESKGRPAYMARAPDWRPPPPPAERG